MIYDCIIYNGEKDLLDIRLHETCLCDDWVTTVIIEADKTHTGLNKPYYFEEYKAEYSRFNLMYLKIVIPEGLSPKDAEIYQRNEIKTALKFLSPNGSDKVIVSDVDEVPRARTVNIFNAGMDFAALIFDKYGYYLNWLESEQSWDRARIMSYSYLKDKLPNDVRDSGYDISLHHAGWHWSWAIDPVKKLESFSHTELNTIQNLEKVSNKENIWSENKFQKIDINLSHPEYLYKNQDKFSHLIDTAL